MKRTKRMMSFVGLFLAMAVPSFAQRVTFTPRFNPPAPAYHPPAPAYHPPAPAYHPSAPSTRSTPPAQTPRSTSQSTSRTQSRPAQTAPQRSTMSTPQSRPAATSRPQPSAREQASTRKEAQKEQKAHANQQKEQQKQNQKQQKEQARQQKEQKKQQAKQQKEEARHQKELQKQEKNNKKATSSAKNSKPTGKNSTRSSAPAAKASTPSTLKSSVTAPAASVSQARIQQLNANRSNLSGINRKPLPAGEMTVHPNGRMTLKAEGGRQYALRSNGTIASYSDHDKTISYDKRGRVSSIHTASMDIHNGPRGQRTIISRRADGSKVVSTGRHSGYVERRVVMNNRTYMQRTTIINHRVFTRTFVVNGFGGVALVPPAFFAPGFYGWAYYPWASPVAFRWGWFGAPWYAGPNPYFVASPLYPSAAFWLTDYMIGETLATAYELHHDAAADMADDMADADTVADSSDAVDSDTSADANADITGDQETLRADATTPVTPELKAEIAEQVKQEMSNDNAEASNPSQASFDTLPAALSTPNHVFVVSGDLDVTTTDQQLCNLQAGDMLQLMSPAASDSSFVQLRVASSKRADCPGGVLVNVSLADLQEMQNSFQAHVEAGLAALHNGQGSNGLPSAPPAAVAAPPQPAVSGLAPASATDSSAVLDQQREQADQAERQGESGSF